MRLVFKIIAYSVLIFCLSQCKSSAERQLTDDNLGRLIMGTYAYTTYQEDKQTGTGTAIITLEGRKKIRIGLDDQVNFYANRLQLINGDLLMHIPRQKVDYYQINARFAGIRNIRRGNRKFDGLYDGSAAELRIALKIMAAKQRDQVTLVMKRQEVNY